MRAPSLLLFVGALVAVCGCEGDRHFTSCFGSGQAFCDSGGEGPNASGPPSTPISPVPAPATRACVPYAAERGTIKTLLDRPLGVEQREDGDLRDLAFSGGVAFGLTARSLLRLRPDAEPTIAPLPTPGPFDALVFAPTRTLGLDATATSLVPLDVPDFFPVGEHARLLRGGGGEAVRADDAVWFWTHAPSQLVVATGTSERTIVAFTPASRRVVTAMRVAGDFVYFSVVTKGPSVDAPFEDARVQRVLRAGGEPVDVLTLPKGERWQIPDSLFVDGERLYVSLGDERLREKRMLVHTFATGALEDRKLESDGQRVTPVVFDGETFAWGETSFGTCAGTVVRANRNAWLGFPVVRDLERVVLLRALGDALFVNHVDVGAARSEIFVWTR